MTNVVCTEPPTWTRQRSGPPSGVTVSGTSPVPSSRSACLVMRSRSAACMDELHYNPPRYWTLTLSKVQVAAAPVVWLVTPRPTNTVCPMLIVSVPTSVHATPSADSYALNVLPLRVSFTQRGAADALPELPVLTPPVAVRRWNAMPLVHDPSMKPCADPASSVSRIMTPAFTQALMPA